MIQSQNAENKEKYAVIVIGGGHAGCEAALAPARMGLPTLLLTQNIETLGQMSCNPAIGGVGKGHLVKEIDALGGMMARAADQAGIHWRILNGSKGPAVHSTRCQADRQLYRMTVRHFLESQANLDIFQQEVADLIIENHKIAGVMTQTGLKFYADAVVLTTGTFLGGRIHIGLDNYAGGRAGDPPSNRLSERLRALPFNVGRLKTGTPPRLDGRTINYAILAQQHGDTPMPVFSFMGEVSEHPRQVPCHITRTTAATHAIIRGGLDRSPMYAGVIEGVGPRYCPSIEDKIVRFADKDSHQIFLEPEGLFTHEVYPNGISTSLPYDVQLNLVRSMPGLENTRITRPGYAIEYDYFDPRDLLPSLATKFIENLFFAGQINGTTGYEEAAAQGLLAGINAGRFAQQKPAWYPRRDEAYLGVLVDDLITLGTNEPYRMFTSRAEHRLILREDNADLRLTKIGYALGLVDSVRWEKFNIKNDHILQETQRLEQTTIKPDQAPAGVLVQGTKAIDLLRRPDWDYAKIEAIIGKSAADIDHAVKQQVEIQAKYAGYITRANNEIEKQKSHEYTALPVELNYDLVLGLSNEVRQKLARHRPTTLGQAGRIAGVTPVSLSLLLVHLKKQSLFVNKI